MMGVVVREYIRPPLPDMLKDFILRKKEAILGRWRQALFDSYHRDAVSFIANQTDRFSNPLGHAIMKGTASILDSLISETLPDETKSSLENLVKIRGVQEFSPSQAVGFLFLLKDAVREELADEINPAEHSADLLKWEKSIDRMALLAFDIYSECRERLADIRIKEFRARTQKILDRAKVFFENTDEEENANGDNR
jgi:hypothetical protein